MGHVLFRISSLPVQPLSVSGCSCFGGGKYGTISRLTILLVCILPTVLTNNSNILPYLLHTIDGLDSIVGPPLESLTKSGL